jgi:uncharacterized short protein YbdD (DUF466 family)
LTYLERQKCYGPDKKILFKKQLFDLEVKGQGPTKVITVCDTPKNIKRYTCVNCWCDLVHLSAKIVTFNIIGLFFKELMPFLIKKQKKKKSLYVKLLLGIPQYKTCLLSYENLYIDSSRSK